MRPPSTLIACPRCSRHVKSHEVSCPHCGDRLTGQGSLKRTVAAVALGITAATALSSELVACAVYGAPCSSGDCTGGVSGSGGSGGGGNGGGGDAGNGGGGSGGGK